jgi:hypothetical protein
MMKGLMRLESWITQLVEEPFVRLFAGRMLPQEVAQHLARAMEDGERLSARGMPEVPGRYRIVLNPEDLAALTAHHPNLDEQLAAALKALASRMHVHLREPPAIILQPDPRMPLRAVHIAAAAGVNATKTAWPIMEERTRDMKAVPTFPTSTEKTDLARSNSPTPRAYLIIEDGEFRSPNAATERIFDLTHPTIRIGRALDNDLILEDKRVSRHHAQLRRRHGRYILQDLGSSGGLKVNGFPVRECVLRRGDVISLADVTVIYAEERESQPPKSDTQPIDQSSERGDRAPDRP